MSPQEYYDKLVEATRDGTFPSYDIQDGCCIYEYIDRNNKIHRCAVGIVMKNPIEGIRNYKSIVETAIEEKAFELDLSEISIEDYDKVQISHDCETYNNNWNARNFIRNINNLSIFKNVKKLSSQNFKISVPIER